MSDELTLARPWLNRAVTVPVKDSDLLNEVKAIFAHLWETSEKFVLLHSTSCMEDSIGGHPREDRADVTRMIMAFAQENPTKYPATCAAKPYQISLKVESAARVIGKAHSQLAVERQAYLELVEGGSWVDRIDTETGTAKV
jgi:hypothetical protein